MGRTFFTHAYSPPIFAPSTNKPLVTWCRAGRSVRTSIDEEMYSRKVNLGPPRDPGFCEGCTWETTDRCPCCKFLFLDVSSSMTYRTKAKQAASCCCRRVCAESLAMTSSVSLSESESMPLQHCQLQVHPNPGLRITLSVCKVCVCVMGASNDAMPSVCI